MPYTSKFQQTSELKQGCTVNQQYDQWLISEGGLPSCSVTMYLCEKLSKQRFHTNLILKPIIFCPTILIAEVFWCWRDWTYVDGIWSGRK